MSAASVRPSVRVYVYLDREGVDVLFRKISALDLGGFQSLILRCRDTFSPATNAFWVTLEDWERLRRYATAHGSGGYQSRLKILLGDLANAYEQSELL